MVSRHSRIMLLPFPFFYLNISNIGYDLRFLVSSMHLHASKYKSDKRMDFIILLSPSISFRTPQFFRLVPVLQVLKS
jgi:hypothetical protein